MPEPRDSHLQKLDRIEKIVEDIDEALRGTLSGSKGLMEKAEFAYIGVAELRKDVHDLKSLIRKMQYESFRMKTAWVTIGGSAVTLVWKVLELMWTKTHGH